MDTIIKQTRVGIVDDHMLFREGLSAILERTMKYKVVFEAENAADALDGLNRKKPDLLLLDLGIDGGSLDVLRTVKETLPDTLCVILTSCDNPLKAMSAMSLGAEGYILKGIKSDDLVRALDGILDNKTYVSPDFAMRLITAANKQSQDTREKPNLSYREHQVISEVQNGLTNREVGERLKLSEQTVKFYMSSAMQKLGVRNRVSAVREFERLTRTSNTSAN